MTDILEENFGLVLNLRREEALRTMDYEDKVTIPEWGNLKPGSCKFSLRAKSLNEAYALLQKHGLAPVPPNHRETYLTSGDPFLSQVEGLVSKESGEYYAREPWQVTVATSAGEQLTWVLVKAAHSHLPPNVRDGQTVLREPLVGPLSSHQVAKEFSSPHAAIGDVIKSRRRKKTTNAKQKQLQDPKLFRICRSRRGGNEGGNHPESGSHNEGSATGNQMVHEDSKNEKRRQKLERKREKAKKRNQGEKEDSKKTLHEIDVGMQVKRGNKKYSHLQAFVEKRRQKRQERRVQEGGAFEKEREEENNLLDFDARVCTLF